MYGEWQGVICTGENSSKVQKYLQQLWNAILLIALILCTGVIVQAQRQSRHSQLDQESELDLKQHIAQKLLALKTRRYHPGRAPHSWAHEIDSCAICLDQFQKNQCLRVLPCLHEFHRDCVDPWLLLQQTCPLCKHNVLGNCC
ncbi:RING finger protein 215 [Pantherophis guttatus]|uniref:RING finger protein 215 n=1 Tax=Pantherophis guttatus TaxID=94885 RepID=A0A6P9CYL8_PANGU|nr:RING finger protein 215 [Pantherophis guttatus]